MTFPNSDDKVKIYLTPEDDQILVRHGYEPLPLTGKRPIIPGWSTRPIDIVALRRDYPGDGNTGLRTGRLVLVDLDLRNPEHVEAVKGLAFMLLGETPLVRLGAKGLHLAYRNETPIDKLEAKGRAPGEERFEGVEILGKGQQGLAYGIHPDTKLPILWPDKSPLAVPLADLPEVTPEALRAFIAECSALLKTLGYAPRDDAPEEEPRQASAATGEPVSRRQLLADLSYLSEHRGPRAPWLRIVAAIRATPIENDEKKTFRRKAAHRFSRGGLDRLKRGMPATYDPAAVDKVFNSMPPKEGERVARYGTIKKAADQVRSRGANRFDHVDPEQFKNENEDKMNDEATAGDFDEDIKKSAKDDHERLVERFGDADAIEDANGPELEYWDDDAGEGRGMMPRYPGGGTLLAYAGSGMHKTNVILRATAEAFLRGARVRFAEGELPYEFGKIRMPLTFKDMGVKLEELTKGGEGPHGPYGRFARAKAVPDLLDEDQVKAFTDASRPSKPDIIVFDTLSRALPGRNENTGETS